MSTRLKYPQVCSGKDFAALLNEQATVSSGVPDSVVRAVLPELVHYVPAPGEEHAVALAFGARVGGGRPVVLMQNSGLGRCLDALLGLQKLYEIGLVLVVVNRGELAWEEPQHQEWGKLTQPLLGLLDVPILDLGTVGLAGVKECFETAYGEAKEQLVILLVHRGNIDEAA